VDLRAAIFSEALRQAKQRAAETGLLHCGRAAILSSLAVASRLPMAACRRLPSRETRRAFQASRVPDRCLVTCSRRVAKSRPPAASTARALAALGCNWTP